MSLLSFIIAAAGEGKRLGLGYNKVFLELRGKPLLAYVLETVETCPSVKEVFIVTREEDMELCWSLVSKGDFKKVRDVLPGGRERQDSVALALERLKDLQDWVAVHDGARPFFTHELLDRVLRAALEVGAALPALPVRETIKKADQRQRVEGTIDRTGLWLAQTPQIFKREWLQEAYRRAQREGWRASDDAALVERTGYPVQLVWGEEINIKITTAGDLPLARALAGMDR
ncbi:MAG TPA: 2-C-methyl-D-erythritol 4-phosphate cytidylyltransferase [Moorella mulderi]|nr:2-C-methyl-D-erythritol 4-phosphate cytidylyltransferase [Moorella mulderi]